MFKKIFSLFILIGIFLSLFVTTLNAQTTEELENQINEYSSKLLELAKSKDTLSNQIKILDSQINLTLLKITQTENSITLLEEEIQNLSVKIDELDVSLNQLSLAFIEQINQNYKLNKRLTPLHTLLLGKFNQALQEFKYISSIQNNSRQTLLDMETIRTNYDLQKQEKKQKQEELVALESRLAVQKNTLAQSKQSKNDLLVVTKNDEARYQKLKSAAEAELSSLLAAKFVGKREVKKGEALGMMGNTGYSFGDHLHFGLYNLTESQLSSWSYPNDLDSSGYVSQYMWPMKDYRITQQRGVTPYSYLYSDRFHHGVDMVSSNKTIYAVNDGVAYFFRNPTSSLGNHVKLFHPDGKMTLYLHMQ